MSAAVALRYEDDDENPVATTTAVHIEATGLTVNETQDAEGISAETPPDPITYYISAEKSGTDSLVSVRFQGEEFTWDNVIFPDDGSWTVHVRKDSDDSSVANVAVTVDAAS